MSKFLFSLWIILTGALLPAIAAPPAQSTSSASAICTIQGVVIRAGTGEPLRKAVIEALPVKGFGGIQAEPGSAMSDIAGKFQITGLVPGEYRLRTTRNGYLAQLYGQRVASGPGETLTLSSALSPLAVTIQMTPSSAISGRVFDEGGDPVPNVQVYAVRYMYMNGKNLYPQGFSVPTNDLGEYRIYGLDPGRYYIRADFQGVAADDKIKQSYVPVYYPGVPDVGRAVPVDLGAGDEFTGADVRLEPVNSVSVKGTVVMSACPNAKAGGMAVISDRKSGSWTQPSVPMTDSNGQKSFEFPSIVAGAYTVTAQVPTEDDRACIGYQSLDVAEASVDSVTLMVAPGTDVTGRVRIENQNQFPSGSISVTLHPIGTSIPFVTAYNEPTKLDGSFTIRNVYEAKYEIFVGGMPDDDYVKAETVDGVDVFVSGLSVDTAHPPKLLDILVSANGASAEGVVLSDGKPFGQALVTLVPDPLRRSVRELYGDALTDGNGRYLIRGIAPGDYKLFAWEKIDFGAFMNSEFLAPYEDAAKSIHITEGSHNTVDLDLIPAKDQDR